MKKKKRNKKLPLFIILLFCGVFCDAGAQGLKNKDKNMDNPFGVLEFLPWNHSWNNYKYSDDKMLEKAAALMKEAGAGWVRIDFLWGEIEPEEGRFVFAKYDKIVEVLAKYNIKILGLLNYSADWASSCGKWNCPPKENRLFVNYALAVISRYKDKIKYWEVWNEPDSYTYWTQQDSLKAYCVLLKEVYLAAKKLDPECKILNGGLANGLASVNHFYDNGAGAYFDILNIHIFQSPLNPDGIKGVAAYPKLAYKIMVRNGDARKKIWVTEIGCPGVKKGEQVKNWWLGENPTEDEQGEWVEKIYKSLLSEKSIDKIFWAFFRDCKQHWSNGTDYFGLVRWDFSRKPAFFAYQKCFRNWRKSK